MRNSGPAFFVPRPCMAIGCSRIAFNGGRWCVAHRNDASAQAESYTKNQAAWAKEHPGFRVPRATFVYAVAGADLVKFGKASCVETRLAELQVGSPVPLTVAAAIGEEPFIERAIHAHLAAFRKHGEWFARADATETVIELMKAGDRIALRTHLGCVGGLVETGNKLVNRRRRLGTRAATIAI